MSRKTKTPPKPAGLLVEGVRSTTLDQAQLHRPAAAVMMMPCVMTSPEHW
jgi:hypothetical protein